MSPAEQAAQVYEREACARSFGEDLEAHLTGGYVISTPEFFVMGRPVDSRAEASALVDPWWVFPKEECDAWLVYLAAGDLREALRWLPFRLPKVAFERRNVLRFYDWDALAGKLGGGEV